MDINPKVGIICCSGEEIPAGTVSRLAVRRVLEVLRPDRTVTLCLPLFLAGGEEEREFARRHPTISVDGCGKLCAKRGTEMYSGTVAVSLDVAEILGDQYPDLHRSTRQKSLDDKAAVWLVAERIAVEVDRLLGGDSPVTETSDQAATAGCACSQPAPAMNLEIHGQPVPVNGLAMIFEHLRDRGVAPTEDSGEALLETVRIYHPVPEEESGLYREALLRAYQHFWRMT